MEEPAGDRISSLQQNCNKRFYVARFWKLSKLLAGASMLFRRTWVLSLRMIQEKDAKFGISSLVRLLMDRFHCLISLIYSFSAQLPNDSSQKLFATAVGKAADVKSFGR